MPIQDSEYKEGFDCPPPLSLHPTCSHKNLSLAHTSATVFIPEASSGLSAAYHFSNGCGNTSGSPTQLQKPAEGMAMHTCIETEPLLGGVLSSAGRVGSSPSNAPPPFCSFCTNITLKKKRDGPHSVQPSAQKELRRSSHELGLRKRTKPPPSPQPSTDPCSTTLRAPQAPRKNPGALGPRTGPGHGAGRGTRRRGDTAVGAADTPRAPVPARPRPPARHVPAAPSGRGSPRSPAPAQSADSAPAPAPGRGAAT